MVKRFSLFIIVTLFCFLFSSLLFSGAATYVGIKKCKMCHMKQFKVWEGTKHAIATKSLVGADLQDPRCLSCHGVMVEHGCETCHGAGSEYGKKDAMKDCIKNGTCIDKKMPCTTCHDAAKTKDIKQMKPQNFDQAKYNERIKHTK